MIYDYDIFLLTLNKNYIMRKHERIWEEEEDLFLLKNYKTKGNKYCSEKLNRTKMAIYKRARKIGASIKNETWKFNKEEFIDIVKKSKSFKDVLTNMGLREAGGNYATIHKYISKYKANTSHFTTQSERIKNTIERFIKKPIEFYLKDNLKVNTSSLKKRLYDEGLKERVCEDCGQTEVWKGKKISLILDHKNGNHYDNRLENLRILCPNCNAALITHCRGIKYIERKTNNDLLKKEKLKEIYIKRRKVNRPEYNQLKKDIKKLGFLQTGKKYNVSDNTIRKWMLFYEKY